MNTALKVGQRFATRNSHGHLVYVRVTKIHESQKTFQVTYENGGNRIWIGFENLIDVFNDGKFDVFFAKADEIFGMGRNIDPFTFRAVPFFWVKG